MGKIIGVLESVNYTTILSDEEHQIVVDEPLDLGGDNKGMTPMSLLASSLASCTAITVQMYAKRKAWDIRKIEVEVTYQNNPETGKIEFIKHLALTGDIDADQIKRLHLIADKCPINKILKEGAQVTSA